MKKYPALILGFTTCLSILFFVVFFGCSGDGEADIDPTQDAGSDAGTEVECKVDRDCNIGYKCDYGKCVSDSELADDDDIIDDDDSDNLCPPVCELPNCTSHCDDPFIGCVIDECTPGFHDIDGEAANGCEYECVETQEGIELCDGRDNDCNGLVDETDVDDPATRSSWMPAGIQEDVENCGRCGERCQSGDHSTPVCAAGSCRLECESGYKEVDPGGDPMQGCEKAMTCSKTNGGVEICDTLDNDCNGVIDEQVRDDGTNICMVGYECRDGEDGRDCYKKDGTGGCTRNCTNKQCGDDGCGGECGYCYPDEICNEKYICEVTDICTPDCSDKKCGDDGCGGDCGVCAGNEVCIGYECAGSFISQTLQMNMTYTPAVIATRNAFLAFRSGDGTDAICSETGMNKGGENEIYLDAELKPSWADQGFPEYKYLNGHEDKIDWKTVSNGDGEYEIRAGLASRCLNELPLVGCTEEDDIKLTVAIRIANRDYKYLCYNLVNEGEDKALARVKVIFGRVEIIPEADVKMYEMKSQASSDKKNCFIK